jgi:SAM-dependent methyltransferase
MKNKSESKPIVGEYWDFIATKSQGTGCEDLWRAHLRDLYQELRVRWRKGGRVERALKTDLYDEAVSRHDVISLFKSEANQIVGADVSFDTAQAARRRLKDTGRAGAQIAVSDARNQGFKAQVFDEILSNSTLDHFSNRAELLASIEELYRIIKPGGMLIITLDNPQNPIVWIRNNLPYRVLKRLGIIPYYMGETLSRTELIRALESKGFVICDSTVVVHSPRIFAIWAGHFLGRMKREGTQIRFRRLLRAFELLERLPTKHITGYYVAVKATKV